VRHAHGRVATSFTQDIGQTGRCIAADDPRWTPSRERHRARQQGGALAVLGPHERPQPQDLIVVADIDWIEVDADAVHDHGRSRRQARPMVSAKRAADQDRGVALTAGGRAIIVIAVLIPHQVQAGTSAQLDDGERPATELGHQRECGIQVRTAGNFVGLHASRSEDALDGLAPVETECSERWERLFRISRLGGQTRVELSQAIVRAGQQEIVHRGEEEVGNRLPGERRLGDGP